jgi:hypothetical protein
MRQGSKRNRQKNQTSKWKESKTMNLTVFNEAVKQQKKAKEQAYIRQIEARREQIRADGLAADYASDGRHNNRQKAAVKYVAVPEKWNWKSKNRAIMKIVRGYASGYYCRESGCWMIDELSL